MQRTVKVRDILQNPLLDNQTEVTIMKKEEDEEGQSYTKHIKGRRYENQIVAWNEEKVSTVTFSSFFNTCRISLR